MPEQALPQVLAAAITRWPPVLHIIRERDVGLFSLIQQVIANVAWALSEGRVPVADFRDRTCYWTPHGHGGGSSVWEYYFEPVVEDFPADSILSELRAAIQSRFPDQTTLGYWASSDAYVTNHYGDHPSLQGKAPIIPYTTGNPKRDLRLETSALIQKFVRPRSYVVQKVDRFIHEHMRYGDFIGVHVRGTDAVSAREQRQYRQGSLNLDRFVAEITRQLDHRPEARILVATDAQSSLDHLIGIFGQRVIAYDAIRHVEGEAAGSGPTGCIMPAYVAADRETAAQNGEDAVVEYLLLSHSFHLIHNGASLATTVLLKEPELSHTNTAHSNE